MGKQPGAGVTSLVTHRADVHLPPCCHAAPAPAPPCPASPRPYRRSVNSKNGSAAAVAASAADLSWLSPDERTREPFTTDPDAAWQLAQDYDLCITGGGGATAVLSVLPWPQSCPVVRVRLLLV